MRWRAVLAWVWLLLGFGVFLGQGSPLRGDDRDRLKVGVQPDGRIVVPTNQVLRPAGKQLSFPGRPVDLAWADGGQTVVVKNMRGLIFLDAAQGEIKQTLTITAGFSVVGLLVHEDRILVTDAQNHVRIAVHDAKGKYQWDKQSIELPRPARGHAHLAGLVPLGADRFWVTATRHNKLFQVDRATGKLLGEVPVGVSPFTLCPAGTDRWYVSNWGGDLPGPNDPQAISSDSPVRIDPRTSVANHGSVSVIERVGGQWKQVKTIPVGLHPSGLARSPGGRFVYVANASSDTVSVLDTRTDSVVETIPCRPEARLPFGSGSNAVAVSPNGHILYVANGTNNCVAVVELGAQACETKERPASSRVAGLIPTGWYPGALLLSPDGKKLFVANVKGHGSLAPVREAEKGMNSHDHLGSVSIIDLPDAAQLARFTQEVNANNRLAYSLNGLEKPRLGIAPVPVPERHGEPSLLKHVIYVIKENRTYDQVFGDMKEGNGDPRLVMFGEEVTPNHHALARQFTLFDNFYCSGVLSADGHSWVNEAYVTDYLEKAFGGFTRSYPYEGSDPLAFPPSGFLWDNALAHGKTFRNYGEFARTSYPKGTTWTDVYKDFQNGTRHVPIEVQANLPSLEPYTHARFPGFPLTTPDVYRAKMFLQEFRAYERLGVLPNLTYVFLPCDHTNGTRPGSPTPKAMVADNDLALGQIVEAVTRSRFWPETAIFVVEDDPQNGFDHVDGHRTVALVVSPYTRRKFVDSTNYNQTGMVKTIELILGLPPMNQLDLSATPMRNCFHDKADRTPYVCLPNRIPLDQMNPPAKALKGMARHWALRSLELNLDEVDQADEDTFNRILWHATRGDAPYPTAFVGSRRPRLPPE